MKRKILSLLLAALTLVTVLAACRNEAPTPGADSGAGNAAPAPDNSPAQTPDDDAQPSGEDAGTASSGENDVSQPTEENYDGRLVFDHAMELSYAKCFSLDYYKGGYKLASLSDGTKILVVPENMSVPADAPEDAIVLRQPVSNIMVSSTPVTSLINAIGALDAISLTTYDADSWYIDEVKEAILDGSLTYVGDYKAPDYEQITAAGTALAIYSAMLTEDVAAQLDALGVDVVLDCSAQEEHPLARVEWAKLYGAIFNKEAEAEEVFNTQAAFVDEIAKAENTGKTVAIFYITSNGSLYARNADDYMAKMVDLAGGRYALPDVGAGESGTAKMELEAFYDGTKDADYIIYIWSVGGKPETVDAFLERAGILADMKAVREGNVWCTTPDFFQIQDTIGSMVNDIHLMLTSDGSEDSFTYLWRLK